MNAAQILAALEAGLTPPLAALKLRLKLADTPSGALTALGNNPEGGTVIINLGSDDAYARGAATAWTLYVTVAAARGLAHTPGADLYKARPVTGRESYLVIFSQVVDLCRRVIFPNLPGQLSPYEGHLTYQGSDWLVPPEDSLDPIRDRTARFTVKAALDPLAGEMIHCG